MSAAEAALAAAQDAARVVASLVQAGMLSDEQREAAEARVVAALLARPLPADLAAEWEVAHRDIKPGNMP